jgi:hypothetical protein
MKEVYVFQSLNKKAGLCFKMEWLFLWQSHDKAYWNYEILIL